MFALPMTYEPRQISPGMGQAVAERTILRRKADGKLEDWADVANRVALGNCSLHPTSAADFGQLEYHIARGNTLMSGRHLQHGDENQASRNMEVFTNCSTAPASFLSFYLLLNGSGVGRCFDDDMMLVNWDYAPTIRCVLDETHADFNYDVHESRRDAVHKFGTGPNVVWHTVEDSREGWAKALELYEIMAFEKIHSHRMLILDFSLVRKKGSPIGGMQNRPASGPVPLMAAFAKMGTLKGSGMEPWLQAMYIDHYASECVLVGGARRAARMSTKHWSDLSIFDFIMVKRPIEYIGLSVDEIIELRKQGRLNPFLWSSNNSVTTDDLFWRLVNPVEGDIEACAHPLFQHANRVFNLLTACSYADGTGEPGIINSHLLVQNDAGWSDLNRGDYVDSIRFHVEDDTNILLSKLAKRAKKKKYHTIVNPCGEIPLNVLGGFCVIADVVPYHCETIEEAEDCFRAVTRALIRVNLMDSIYDKEVKRTNRIGVGMTGIHEFAWKFFGYGFKDLIDEVKSQDFWQTLRRFNKIVHTEAVRYSKLLGVAVPHTMTTIKPSGSVSKLFALTEGWHLPSMREFLRHVQFRTDDPLVETYRTAGYPVRELVSYSGTTIVGFPTAPAITTLGMGDKLMTAAEASPEDQFQWLKLGEKYWIEGEDAGHYGGQISFTMKYSPDIVSFEHFTRMILEHQADVRCCSVMPQEDAGAYEYTPEEPVTKARFDEIVAKIVANIEVSEDIGKEHIDCAGGACPVFFGEKA
jgi:adenosylcobalamin-dependent ribonucleoside-triphosphate reductase